MYKYMFFVLIAFFVGCTNPNTNISKEIIEDNNFSSKNYVNISKDAIFEAAKKVFLLAGKDEFRIDSYRDHLVVSKTKVSHYPFYVIVHDDIWDLQIDEKNNTSFAKLSIKQVTDFDEEKAEYLSLSTHDLFWSRVEYLLGLSDDWKVCTNNIEFSDILCDSIDMNNSKNTTKNDLVQDILIVNRKRSKNINETNDDILKEDIDFTLDEPKDDLLSEINNTDQTNEEKTLNDDLDKEIEDLNRKVNINIDKTLDKIDKEITDEKITEGK